MSGDSEDDELKLTKKYKYLLSYIRPLIDQLDKSKDAQLCLLWLSKLEQCKSWERCYRNKILLELCKQVKDNCLKPPFNDSPPSGPLRDLVCGDRIAPTWRKDKCTEDDITTEETLSSSTQHSFEKFKRHTLMVPWKDRSSNCIIRAKQSTKPIKETVDHSECFAIQNAYQERAQSDQMVIEKYQDIIKSLVSQQIKADMSPSKLKKLQSTYETKMTQLVHSLKKLQEENSVLKQEIDSYNNDSCRLDGLMAQNDSLKKQVRELESVKNSLEDQHKKSEDEKLVALKSLVEKLNESEKKLKETEKRFQSLEKKYEESCQHFNATEENEGNEEKENKFKAELTELERLLEEKQEEINDLEKQIKSLKNKTKKLEKLRDHMAILFESHLQQIVSKKDFYIATLEMQLKMNSLESGRNFVGSDLHNALNEKVTELETQYRRLLQESEQQFMRRRQCDLQKIHILEKQLLKFGEVIEDSQLTANLKTRSLTSVTAIEKEKWKEEALG